MNTKSAVPRLNQQAEIKRQLEKALACQFEAYSFEQMIEDAMEDDFSENEIQWAKENLTYGIKEVTND